jgi:hypothetical protein
MMSLLARQAASNRCRHPYISRRGAAKWRPGGASRRAAIITGGDGCGRTGGESRDQRA